MIASHAPYDHLLGTMFAGITDPQQLCQALESRKTDVLTLRRSFKQNMPEADYSQKSVCDAYMLMYYPYYIETIHHLFHIINSSDPASLKTIFEGKTKITVSFLGTGPSPELLGLVGYLSEHQPQIQTIEAVLVDLNTPSWQHYRVNYTIPMIAKYGNVATSPQDITCNLLDCYKCSAHLCDEFLKTSDIVIMQNCITDLVTARNKRGDVAGFSFLDLFLKLHPGALFLVTDLNYDNTFEALNEIVTAVESSESGRILCRSHAYQSYKPQIVKPACLTSLFDGSDGLKMKEHTRFHFTAIQRKCSEAQDETTEPVDWVKEVIASQIAPLGFSIASVKDFEYRRRYNLASQEEHTGENFIDIIYNGKEKITKVKLQGSIQATAVSEPLMKELIGKNLIEKVDQADVAIPPADSSLESAMLQSTHDALVAKLAANGCRVLEIKYFQYMVRYKVASENDDRVIFDRYYNARNHFTKTLFQGGISNVPDSWSPLIKLMPEIGE